MSLDFYLENDRCVSCGRDGDCVLHINLTHNLCQMAAFSGLYEPLWGAMNGASAKTIQEALGAGINSLVENEAKARTLSPENGWGSYGGLLEAAQKALRAALEYPESKIRVRK